jgi:hypothetical protein
LRAPAHRASRSAALKTAEPGPDVHVEWVTSAGTGAAAFRAALAGVPRHALREVGGLAAPDGTTTVAFGAAAGVLLVLFEAVSEPPLEVGVSSGGPVFRDECVELFLAEPGTPTTYREFVVNPAGAVYSAIVTNPDDSRATWKVAPGEPPPGLLIDVAGHPDGAPPAWHRWTCLLGVPLASVRASGRAAPPGALFRANAFRIARGRTTRFLALRPTGRSAPPDFHVPSRFAALRIPEAAFRSGDERTA